MWLPPLQMAELALSQTSKCESINQSIEDARWLTFHTLFPSSKVFETHTVRNCLSLMFSCGMYDYSGGKASTTNEPIHPFIAFAEYMHTHTEFAYSVGLPAKSGVAGCVYAVIPNLLGICIWSPRLDQQGNSHRAVRFFEKLTERYAFHVFDEVTGDSKKKNPRLRLAVNQNINTISEMCYAAANGDLTRIMYASPPPLLLSSPLLLLKAVHSSSGTTGKWC